MTEQVPRRSRVHRDHRQVAGDPSGFRTVQRRQYNTADPVSALACGGPLDNVAVEGWNAEFDSSPSEMPVRGVLSGFTMAATSIPASIRSRAAAYHALRTLQRSLVDLARRRTN